MRTDYIKTKKNGTIEFCIIVCKTMFWTVLWAIMHKFIQKYIDNILRKVYCKWIFFFPLITGLCCCYRLRIQKRDFSPLYLVTTAELMLAGSWNVTVRDVLLLTVKRTAVGVSGTSVRAKCQSPIRNRLQMLAVDQL